MYDEFPDPQRLQEDLEQVLGDAPEPSDLLRARVLDYAARRQPQPVRRRAWRRPALAAVAAAAVLTLLLVRPDRAPLDGDLNLDGRVDILDAWQLSHAMQIRAKRDGQDQTGPGATGAITPDDLDRLLQRIVSVGEGTS